ncbi:metallophosphoesterase [Bifidobacterium dolichotidis]|nr:metallophosphoesterase [Bifidobacterium dolichotidis]
MTERTERIRQNTAQPPVLSVSARLGRLQFHNSGKFRVLQFADVQDGPKVAKDTIRLIEAALTSSRPDVVIFSGNQIAGYNDAYAATYCQRRWATRRNAPIPRDPARREADLAHTRDLVRQTISQITAPLVKYGVPWAITFGNHDFQCGLSNAEIEAICCEFPGCLNVASASTTDACKTPAKARTQAQKAAEGDISADTSVDTGSQVENKTTGAQDASAAEPKACANCEHPQPQPVRDMAHQVVYPCEPGTLALPVASADEDHHTVMGLVLVDSGDYSINGGYGAPTACAMKFLSNMPQAFGEHVRSIVFQHTALPQFYELLEPAQSTAAHAVEGYRAFSGQYYVLDESAVEPGGFIGEGISCPDVDSGEFDLLHKTQGYFAVSVGHDHRNAIDGLVRGIRLIETPTCGFGSYGPVPAKRAARLLEFDIRHPFNPRSQLLEFGELVGKPSSKKAYAYGMTSASKSESEGVDLLHKPSWISRLLHRFAMRLR